MTYKMSTEKSFLTLVIIITLLFPCLAFGSPVSSDRIYYLSLGDSYAEGEPTPKGPAYSYADALYELLKKDYSNLELVKYGCHGVTSGGIINRNRCNETNPKSQLDQAVDFMKSNEGMIKFVTIIIGTNDLHKCGDNDDECVSGVLEDLSNHLTEVIIPKLKEAGGNGVRYAGSTYYKSTTNLLDDRLSEVYHANGFRVADIRSVFGTNGNSDEYEKRVCLYTNSCNESHDDHPNVLGSRAIGDLHYKILSYSHPNSI